MQRLIHLVFIIVFCSSGFGRENNFANENAIALTKIGHELVVKTENGQCVISVFSPTVFHVVRTKSPIKTLAVEAAISNDIKSVRDFGDKWVVCTDSLVLQITKSPLSFGFYNAKNMNLYAGDIRFFSNDSLVGTAYTLADDEKMAGGGERALPLNRRGTRLKMYNEPHWGYQWNEPVLNFSMPFFYSSNRYGLFFDSPSLGWADIGATVSDKFSYTAIAGEQGFYFIGECSYKAVQQSFALLTGKQPMPARWMLGNLQSRFGYKTQSETLNMADTMLTCGYPLDALIIDLYWFGKGPLDWKMGALEWNKTQWPQPKQMISTLADKGVKTILIAEPFILKSEPYFNVADSLNIFAKGADGKTGAINDFYFGPAGLLDLFCHEACNWFWQRYNDRIKEGIAGWWGDLGEPERHPSFLIHQNGMADAVHNIYGHYWSKMLSDKYRTNYPATRLFHLNRSGFAGSQRYNVFPWSGDVGRGWGGLKAQLPIMQTMSFSCIPYIHSDLGGFAAGVKDEELYTRWLQMGVFNPIFRPHGESIPSEPVYFTDATQNIVREFIKLRYRMIPYNYTLAYNQATEGKPLVRPVMWETNHSADFDNMNQYFWGDNLLVAPDVQQGTQIMPVYLPNGVWYNFFDGTRYAGGDTVFVKESVDRLPVFARGGSMIALSNHVGTMDGYKSDGFTIHYYVGCNNEVVKQFVYEDDGKDANAVARKKYELITITATNKNGKITVALQSKGERFAPKNGRKITVVVHDAISADLQSTDAVRILPYIDYVVQPKVKNTTWKRRKAKIEFNK